MRVRFLLGSGRKVGFFVCVGRERIIFFRKFVFWGFIVFLIRFF